MFSTFYYGESVFLCFTFYYLSSSKFIAVDPGVVGGYPCGQERTSEGGREENLGAEDLFCPSSPATKRPLSKIETTAAFAECVLGAPVLGAPVQTGPRQ